MSVRVISEVPDELPHAHLYLDDVEEVCKLVSKTLVKNDNESCKVEFSTGELVFDSVDDLLSHGGGSSKLTIQLRCGYRQYSVKFHSVFEPTIYDSSLDSSDAWALYGKVKAIFERRQYRLKNALFALPGWLKLSFFPSAWIVFDILGTSKARTPFWVSAFGLYALVALICVQPSRVSFVRSRDSFRHRAESRRGYARDLLMIVCGGIIGQLITYFAKKWLK